MSPVTKWLMDGVRYADGTAAPHWWKFYLCALIGLHVVMDGSLDIPGHNILDEQKFLRLHGAYIATSTVQWLISLALLALTLRRWGVRPNVDSSPSNREPATG